MIEIEGKTILSRLVESLRPYVPRIHVVIGYREEIVAEYCARHHRDVILVRNPSFRETNTAHSLALGSVGFKNKVLYMDGDILINPASLAQFIENATSVPLLVGVTAAKTSQAVYVDVEKSKDYEVQKILAFSQTRPTPHEWANVFAGSPDILGDSSRFVFECLEPRLPLSSCALDLFEIDTDDDLKMALNGVSSWIDRKVDRY